LHTAAQNTVNSGNEAAKEQEINDDWD
jgi:hypothetical protein